MKKYLQLTFLLVNACVFSQVNLNSSLTACYALNGNASEPINTLTGTLSAVTATVDRFSNASSALAFNGSTVSYVELPDSPLLKPTNAISFSAWIKTNVLTSQYILMTKNSAVSNFEAYCLTIVNLSGQCKFRAQKGDGLGGTVIVTGTNSLSASTWYHVTVTIDNSNINLYTNGSLVATTALTIPFNYMTNKKVILGGSNEPAFNLPFNGSMDNIRFYNRVLNASEVSQLYTLDPSCTSGLVPAASFSSSPSAICVGQSVSFTDLSTNTPTAWAWQMASTTTTLSSSVNNPNIIFPALGSYTVALVSTNAFGASNTATQVVTVNSNPTVNATSNSSLICVGQSATLTAVGATNYLWNTSATGSVIAVSPTVSTIYSVTGTNSVTGCSNATSVIQNVSQCTGLLNITANNSISIYPNPTKNIFFISELKSDAEVEITNTLGQLLHAAKTDSKTLEIDLSNNKSGVYFIKILTENGIVIKKIIKE